MKKFVKGKWFPLTLAAVIAAILALILFLFGFRITCSPEQDNNWDAVSACASWVGVIASFVAIWFAIQVPKKIADRQDKIALFEKRYQVYNLFKKLMTTMYFIELPKKIPVEKIKFTEIFDSCFSNNLLCENADKEEEILSKKRIEIFELLHAETDKLSILFPISKENENEIHEVLNLLSLLMSCPSEEIRIDMLASFNALKEKGIFDVMRRELNIF